MAEGDELIGVTIERAAQLVGVPVRQLARWDAVGLIPPRAHRVLGRRHVRIYGLAELVEACIVRQLMDQGVSARKISTVVRFHRSASSPKPLRELTWAADDGGVYVKDASGNWWGGRVPGQGVLPEVIDLAWLRAALRARATERRGEDVGRIERRPRTHRRKPVLAGTRTPVEAIIAYIDRGYSDDEILEAFPHLSIGDIDAVRSVA